MRHRIRSVAERFAKPSLFVHQLIPYGQHCSLRPKKSTATAIHIRRSDTQAAAHDHPAHWGSNVGNWMTYATSAYGCCRVRHIAR
jgi:hypothetical protein